MTANAPITPDIFEAALKAARDLQPQAVVRGLATVPDNAMFGRLDEAWETAEGALREAFHRGKEGSRQMVESALTRVEEIVESAKAKANELRALLFQKIRAFVQNLFEKAIGAMPAAVVVGNRTLDLHGVKYTRKLGFSGALKINLLEAVELVSEGGIEIEFEYAVPAA